MPIAIARPNLYARPNGRGKPMGEMNVTPFIDVLLVLVIMIIMVVPIATHETEVDLPGDPPNPIDVAANTVFIDTQDRLFWNGAMVSRDQLTAQVYHAAQLPNEPLLRFEPSATASYDASAKAIALIKDAGAQKFAFIGNHRHRDFGM
ncbi:MAG: biopolymer transporter ExbD [Erythrobacter sp.]